jgi:diaminopropionate ammonia-lyase
VIDGAYEDAVAAAADAAQADRTALISDVGASGPAEWVIDGYATLFAEAAEQAAYDLIVVPVGVGSLAAAAARHGAQVGAQDRRRTRHGRLP